MMLMIQFLMQKWVIRWDCGFHSSKWDTTKTHFRRSQGVVKQFPVGWLSTIAFTLCTVILAHLRDSVMIMQVPCSSMKYRNEHYVCTNVSCSDYKTLLWNVVFILFQYVNKSYGCGNPLDRMQHEWRLCHFILHQWPYDSRANKKINPTSEAENSFHDNVNCFSKNLSVKHASISCKMQRFIIIYCTFSHSAFHPFWTRNAIMRHNSGSTLSQVMACCLTTARHYLKQCSLVISCIIKVFPTERHGIIKRAIHYSDVIMNAMASQNTGVSIVYSTVCSGAYQRKHQLSASPTFFRGIHQWPVNSPLKGSVTKKTLAFDDVIMILRLFCSSSNTCILYNFSIIAVSISKARLIIWGNIFIVYNVRHNYIMFN